MIDFTNKSIIKLKPSSINEGQMAISTIMIPSEEVKFAFTSMRDKLVFTNKRIISINVQGITGKKVDYTSIPYSKIQVFSIETAGTFDLDSELDVTISRSSHRFRCRGNISVSGLFRNIWALPSDRFPLP